MGSTTVFTPKTSPQYAKNSIETMSAASFCRDIAALHAWRMARQGARRMPTKDARTERRMEQSPPPPILHNEQRHDGTPVCRLPCMPSRTDATADCGQGDGIPAAASRGSYTTLYSRVHVWRCRQHGLYSQNTVCSSGHSRR